jgi:hypothetical protein
MGSIDHAVHALTDCLPVVSLSRDFPLERTVSQFTHKGYGLPDPTGIGGTDVGFLLTWCQIGAIGLSIQLLLWFLFLRSSYLCAKSDMISNIYRSVSLAIFGILIGFMIVNIHFSPWECISLSPTYYLLGAISTSVYIRLKRMKRCRIL